MKPLNLSRTAVFCFSLLAVPAALALPTDRGQPIHGSADNLVVDQKNGLATYTGSVTIEQGSLKISADTIVIHTRPDGSADKIIATGAPAHFQQQLDADQSPVTASATKITYTPDDERLLLVENASLEQDGSVMSGPKIDYDLVKEIMRATGNNQQGKRIDIVIPPQADQKKP